MSFQQFFVKPNRKSLIIPVFMEVDVGGALATAIVGSPISTPAGVAFSYLREGDAAHTVITSALGVLGTWTAGSLKEFSTTAAPGMYQFGVPDACLASGRNVGFVDLMLAFTASRAHVRIHLVRSLAVN